MAALQTDWQQRRWDEAARQEVPFTPGSGTTDIYDPFYLRKDTASPLQYVNGPVNFAANGFSVGTNQIVTSGGKTGFGRTPTTYAMEVQGDLYATGLVRGDGSGLSNLGASNFAAVAANRVLAGATSGGAATPTFRALVASDIPALSYEAPIAAGVASQYWRGDKTWQTLNTAAVTESTNLYWTQARFDTAFTAKTTSDLAEGINLYYTLTRFNTAFAGKTTTDLTEGTNLYYTSARFDAAFATKTTSNLTEGSNLYYTTARFDAAFATKTTTNLTEGINLYWTQARFDTAFAAKSTSNLTEGTNLYFTNARARLALSSASANQIVYNSTTGAIGTPQDIHTGASPTFTALTLSANGLTVGTSQLVAIGGNVGIGTATPGTYKLYVNGTSYFSGAQSVNGDMMLVAATANLYMKDTATGFTAAATTVVNLVAGSSLRSSNFTAGVAGFNIGATGSIEAENILARGEFRASVFKVGEITATGGTVVVSTGASTLTAIATTPAATGSSFSLSVKKSDAGGALFATNDVLRIKSFTGSGVTEAYATVTAVNNAGADTVLTATFNSGSTLTNYGIGTAIVNLGPSGSGQIWLSSDGTVGASPNMTMTTHAGSPWSVTTTLLRAGNLNGAYGYATDIYGWGVGQYGSTGIPWITVDTTNGIRIGGGAGGTTVLGQWDISGNLALGQVATNSGNAFWNNANKRLEFRGGTSGTVVSSYVDTTGKFVMSTAEVSGTLTVSGAISAASGDVLLDTNGFTVRGYSGTGAVRQMAFTDGTKTIFDLYTTYSGTQVDARVEVPTTATGTANSISLIAASPSANKSATVYMTASSGTYGSATFIGSATSTGTWFSTSSALSVGSGAFPPTGYKFYVAGDANVSGALAVDLVYLGTGLRQGTMTSGRVLRSDGTNFISASLAAADLSNGVTGSGSVVLAAAPAFTGNVTFDATTLCVDAVNDRVGIRTASPVAMIESPISNLLSSGKFGSIEFQSYAVNNAWISENMTYNGTNFVYRATGYANLFYFLNGGFSVRVFGSASAGATASGTNNTVLYSDVSGNCAMGGLFAFTGVSGASLAASSNGGVAIGSTYTGSTPPAHGLIVQGAVGLGVTSTTYKLDVNGTVRASGAVTLSGYGAGTLTTDASGNVTASSDRRLKDVVGDFKSGLAAVRQLRPVHYYWNAASGFDRVHRYVGYIAQDVMAPLPDAVGRTPGSDFLTLDTRVILAAHTNAIKELDTSVTSVFDRLDSVEAQILTLRKQLEELEGRYQLKPTR